MGLSWSQLPTQSSRSWMALDDRKQSIEGLSSKDRKSYRHTSSIALPPYQRTACEAQEEQAPISSP